MSEMNRNAPYLSVKDLVVEYMSDGQVVHAVNGVSLTLERGTTLGLVGETGAGKNHHRQIHPADSSGRRREDCGRSGGAGRPGSAETA